MKKAMQGAKIACLDMNLQKTRMHLGVNILIDDPDQLEDIRKRYRTVPIVLDDRMLMQRIGNLTLQRNVFKRSSMLVQMSF